MQAHKPTKMIDKIKKLLVFTLLINSFLVYSNFTLNVASLRKTVEFKEPYYIIDYQASKCNFEFFVNEIPVLKHFNGGEFKSQYPINQFVLSTGKQSLRIKILPEDFNKFDTNSQLKFKIFCFDAAIPDQPDHFEVLSYESPKVYQNNLPILDKIDFFSAKVPYSVSGWKNATKIENEKTNLILEEYKQIFDLFREKDVEKLYKKMKLKYDEIDTSMYVSGQNNKLDLQNLLQQLHDEGFVLQEFPKNSLVYYYDDNLMVQATREDAKSFINYVNPKTKEEFDIPIFLSQIENEFVIIR